MTNYLRKNAWDANNGGKFEDESGNPTHLLWYAKAVKIMQARPIEDSSSWWFYAAIHGEFLTDLITDPNYTYLNWTNINYINSEAKLDKLPPTKQSDLFWNQCQHACWFFPPWHRGYLVALEVLLKDIITNQLDGPEDWAMPYWNYLSNSSDYTEKNIPPAFTQESLPDGSSNPLYVPERYGPNGDSNIYVEVGERANDKCQLDTIYNETSSTDGGTSQNLNGYYYGGEKSGFNHGSGGTGDLESSPHNSVHTMVGGRSNSSSQSGLMAVPATAALDPIFYLHHANIDRMWTAWNKTGNNSNPTDNHWLKGPQATGDRHFAMPIDANYSAWNFTPEDVDDTEKVNYNGSEYSYTYDDLSLQAGDADPSDKIALHGTKRLAKLGVENVNESLENNQMAKKQSELIGASDGAIKLNNADKTKAVVQLNRPSVKLVEKSLLRASVSKMPDEVFLQLEDVKGADDANFLSIYLNNKLVSSVSLFGLHNASAKNSKHGGEGLTFRFNISHLMDDLHLDGNMDVDSLDVSIASENEILDHDEITIGRIGIYRVGE